MQLTNNVNNSGTFIPMLCSEIYQSVYLLAVMRSPICGRDLKTPATAGLPTRPPPLDFPGERPSPGPLQYCSPPKDPVSRPSSAYGLNPQNNVVKCCQDHFGFDLPSVSWSKWVKKFEALFRHRICIRWRNKAVYNVLWICRERTAKTVNCCNYSYFV